jgi:hypothetical protein
MPYENGIDTNDYYLKLWLWRRLYLGFTEDLERAKDYKLEVVYQF